MTVILTADMFNLSTSATQEDIASFNSALAYLSQSDTAVPIMLTVATSGTTINFVHGNVTSNSIPDDNVINWNPTRAAALFINPAGVVLWALADDIVAKRIDDGNTRRTAAEWKSGTMMRIVDVVAPFGAEAEMREQVQTMSQS